MVEKIDKTEPPPPYFIQATTETRRDKERESGQQRESDEYSGSHAAPDWQKIYAAAANRRYLKIRREDIARAWFKGTAMQRGISLVEVDLEIKDCRILKSAHIILPTREDFWTLKKFQPGQELPLNMIVRDTVLEISVPAPRPAVSNQTPEKVSEKGHKEKTDIKKIVVYVAIGVLALIMIIFAITR